MGYKTAMYYFAYGSNMKTKRLKDRVGKVTVIGKAGLSNHCLRFNKLGDDETGKANIETKENSLVEGVLFNLTEEQFKKLDICEAVPTHYIRCKMNVIRFDNDMVAAAVYIANPNRLRSHLKPKQKYLQYLIDGANEHGLSNQYKQSLASSECI